MTQEQQPDQHLLDSIRERLGSGDMDIEQESVFKWNINYNLSFHIILELENDDLHLLNEKLLFDMSVFFDLLSMASNEGCFNLINVPISFIREYMN